MKTKKSHKAVVWAIISLVLLTAAIVVIGGTLTACGNGTSKTPVASNSPGSAGNGTTWKMHEGNYGGNRWFTDGIAAIKHAKTKAQAEAAANVWLDKVKRDPNLLVGATAYFLDKSVTKKSLVKKGWATDKAVQLTSEIQIALGQSRITPSVAPSNGTNSGVASSHVVAASSGGISGNRKAVKIVLPNGKKIWIMARCGNPVVMGKPPVPTVVGKKWWLDPFAQGNAPIGGGQNQNPGPGTYTDTPDKPGPAPYTPPPTPAPQPTGSATPDPQPTPTPEATGTAGGTVTPPGM